MPLIFAVSWTKLSSGSVSVIVVTGRMSLGVTAIPTNWLIYHDEKSLRVGANGRVGVRLSEKG